jgi:hypothetical protein
MWRTAHVDMPRWLWDEFLPQGEITLNMMRPYALDKSISAYNGMHGHKYDHAAHPMAPVGTQVLIFESPIARASWGDHGVEGWYLSPKLDAYRVYNVYVKATRRKRMAETLAWKPEPYMMPGSTTEEIIIAAVSDLANALTVMIQANNTPDNERNKMKVVAENITESIRYMVNVYQGSNSGYVANKRVVPESDISLKYQLS